MNSMEKAHKETVEQLQVSNCTSVLEKSSSWNYVFCLFSPSNDIDQVIELSLPHLNLHALYGSSAVRQAPYKLHLL